MPWIESHTVLLRHRKLLELARELRLRPAHLMGHLHALWHAALEQQEDGDLSSWTDEFIADSSDYPGDAPQYVRLLQKHGWLNGRLLHDWLDYAGAFLTGKYHTSKRGRLFAIWKKHNREYGKRGSIREKSLESHSTLPNQPNQTVPTNQKESGGEKRRFVTPSVREVRDYAESIGFHALDGEAFVSFYESKGWVVGKSPMRSWQAAVRTWRQKEKNWGGINGTRKLSGRAPEREHGNTGERNGPGGADPYDAVTERMEVL